MFNQNQINLDRYNTINAEHASNNVSDKYKFIPTKQVLEVFNDNGFFPVKVIESNTRIEEKKGFQKHMIRLRNAEFNRTLAVGDVLPEIVLINSHCGTASFQLSAGLYRCVCSNQLCVPQNLIADYRVRHLGYEDNHIEQAIKALMQYMPKALESQESMSKVTLEQPEKEAFAKAAIELRFDGESYSVPTNDILRPRRYADNKNDLWSTFNTVQENIIKGGVRTYNKLNQRRRSTEVKGIDANVSLNRSLWVLAEEMRKLKMQ